MARNRKRAKERRARRPEGTSGRGRTATAPPRSTPDPLGHAAPDVELADAQVALGRARFDRETRGRGEPLEAEVPDSERAEAESIDYGQARAGAPDSEPAEAEPAESGRAGAEAEFPLPTDGERGNGRGGAPPSAIALGRSGATRAASTEAGVEPRVTLLARLIGFLQGSWRELQRVQWPDRRQVAQATSVVIGFVIVAGVFLGLADLAFSHLMNYVLYGK